VKQIEAFWKQWWSGVRMRAEINTWWGMDLFYI